MKINIVSRYILVLLTALAILSLKSIDALYADSSTGVSEKSFNKLCEIYRDYDASASLENTRIAEEIASFVTRQFSYKQIAAVLTDIGIDSRIMEKIEKKIETLPQEKRATIANLLIPERQAENNETMGLTGTDGFSSLDEANKPVVLENPASKEVPPALLITPLNSRGEEVRVTVFPAESVAGSEGLTLSYPKSEDKFEQIFGFPKEDLQRVLVMLSPQDTNQALALGATLTALFVIKTCSAGVAALILGSKERLEDLLSQKENDLQACLLDDENWLIHCPSGSFVMKPAGRAAGTLQ